MKQADESIEKRAREKFEAAILRRRLTMPKDGRKLTKKGNVNLHVHDKPEL